MNTSITRDTWGIGHAQAADPAAAFRAQGWMAASDRMWQMEWDRLRVQGQWATVAGAVGVREDKFFRRLGLAATARADWESLSPSARRMTEAYAEGVNAWLESNRHQLPAEFDVHPSPPAPWEGWHCVAVYKVRHLFMGTFFRKLWRGSVVVTAGPEAAAAMRGNPGAAAPMVPGEGRLAAVDLLEDVVEVLQLAADDLSAIEDTDGGSNSWAVHGSRTKSGKPILAGDPHRGIEFPNVYHQCHLACPEFDVIGLAFPGVPGFPHFGHNADVAWCITHGMADDTDVFVEAGPIDWRTEVIEVADGAPVEVTCGMTERGPVVLGDGAGGAPVLSIMWTGMFGPDTTFEALEPMLFAGSCSELEEAVRPWVIPVNNQLSADIHGDISLKIRGLVVERSVASRWAPVAGTESNQWDGLTPTAFDDLPSWSNPDRGFLVTANNRIADAGPYISLDFAGPSRHDRIVQLLSGLDAATNDDMQAIHGDVLSLPAERIVPLLLEAEPTTDLGREAQALLHGWDRQVTADSAAAAVYGASRRCWTDLVGALLGMQRREFGERGWPEPVGASRMLHEAASVMLLGGGANAVPGIDTEADLLRTLGQAIDSAAAQLAEQQGSSPSDWRWDRAHQMASAHPLASVRPELSELHPPLDGCAGDGDTVRAGSIAPAKGDRSVFASVARYCFDLSDWDQSGWVVPHGVSGVRGSGHDLDQRQSWLDCALLPMLYTPASIAAHAGETVSLDL